MLATCSQCDGFVPNEMRACPNCGARQSCAPARLGMSRLGTLAVGGAMAMTLMACYGGPHMYRHPAPPPQPDGDCASANASGEPNDESGARPPCAPVPEKKPASIATEPEAPPNP